MSIYLDTTKDPALAVIATKVQKKLVELICGMTDNEEPPETLHQIESMLKDGVNPSVPDYNLFLYYTWKNYFSPVHYAARKGLHKVMGLLLEYGANPNAVDRYNVTAAHVAAHSGSAQCLKRLLIKGAKADCETLVMSKAVKEELRLLRQEDPESEDDGVTEDDFLDDIYASTSKFSIYRLPYVGKTTPLHLAARHNNAECVYILMCHGANYNAVDENGNTPLFMAAAGGLPDCVMMLLKEIRGVPIISVPKNDSTALHECFRHGEKMNECIRELVRHGSDIGLHDKEGNSPVLLALKQQWDTDVIKFMLLHGYGNDFDPSSQGTSDCDSNKARIQPCLLTLAMNGQVDQSEMQQSRTNDETDNNNNGNPRMIIHRDEDMAAFYISMGMYRSKHREFMVRELRREDPSDIIVQAVKDTFAYLPRLCGVELFGSDHDYDLYAAKMRRSSKKRSTSSVGRAQSRGSLSRWSTFNAAGIRGGMSHFRRGNRTTSDDHNIDMSLESRARHLHRIRARRLLEDMESFDMRAYETHLRRVETMFQWSFLIPRYYAGQDWYSEPDGNTLQFGNRALSASGKKKKNYLQQRYQLPSLGHLCRCVIRDALQDKVGKVVTLPLPKHIKEYILLEQKLPEGS